MTNQLSFGYHIHAEVINDANRSKPVDELWRHLDRLKHRGGGHLVLNKFDFAIEVARRQPNHIIFARPYSIKGVKDSDAHLGNLPPSAFVETIEKDWQKAKAAGVTNIVFTTLNEPHPVSAQQIVDWHTNVDRAGNPIPSKAKGVLDLCAEKRIPIAAMQLGISDWELHELEILVPVFRKISQHDDLFSVAIHEYFGVVPSSGMPLLGNKDPEFEILEGAWPSKAAKDQWLKDGKPYFAIQPENWPTNTEERKYHVGRHQDLIDVCERQNPPIPRLIIDITEAGADDMNEGGQGFVGAWFKSIKVSTGFFNPRFWRSLAAQWAIWYGQKKGWDAQETYWHMLKWLLKNVWTAPYKGKSRRIRSVIIFAWWNSGVIGSAEDWTASRVDNAYVFQGEHEKWVMETTPPPPQPVTIAPTDPRFRAYKAYVNGLSAPVPIHEQPANEAPIIGALHVGGVAVDHITPARLTAGEQQATAGWLTIKVAGSVGFVVAAPIRMEEVVAEPPPPPPDTVTIPKTEYETLKTAAAELETERGITRTLSTRITAIRAAYNGIRANELELQSLLIDNPQEEIVQ